MGDVNKSLIFPKFSRLTVSDPPGDARKNTQQSDPVSRIIPLTCVRGCGDTADDSLLV